MHSSIGAQFVLSCVQYDSMRENIFYNRVVDSISQFFGPLGAGQLLGHPEHFYLVLSYCCSAAGCSVMLTKAAFKKG